jgi:hypothetical protein
MWLLRRNIYLLIISTKSIMDSHLLAASDIREIC